MSERQTFPGTALTSTATSTTSIRVFFQDSALAIREFRHSTTASPSWSGGSSSYRITSAKRRRAPLAVKEWTDSGTRRIRAYTLDAQDKLQELCCDGEGSWSDGYHGPTVASFSDLATTVYTDLSLRRIRIFYQLPNCKIKEHCNDEGWVTGSTMGALTTSTTSSQPIEGTAIASIGWGDTGSDIRTYVQDDGGHICEYNNQSDWASSRLSVRAKLHSPLTAVTWKYNDTDGRQIRIYYLNDDNIIHEYCYSQNSGWWYPSTGSIATQAIKAAPYSRLSAVMWKNCIRLYYQPSGKDTIEEVCYDFGTGWYIGASLSVTASSSKPIDVDTKTYKIGNIPYLLDIVNWRNYDPSTIDGVGILIGYEDGHLIGEDLKKKQSTYLEANTKGNSYTYVYTPSGSIVYRLWDHDHRDDYVRHSQLGSGKDVICAGEFRVSQSGYIDSVIVMANDASGHYQPTGSECLASVSDKLESLGITTDNTDWYWK